MKKGAVQCIRQGALLSSSRAAETPSPSPAADVCTCPSCHCCCRCSAPTGLHVCPLCGDTAASTQRDNFNVFLSFCFLIKEELFHGYSLKKKTKTNNGNNNNNNNSKVCRIREAR
ncbi:hypothetical protein F2P81_006061 [Scophthalmus maximus]|uniref:Uncharacterized protein n=1 Tax=Scophthalmus maximus TaxID=52904 RepID=A0A6A4TCE0_SCOMX|nr:hypothetical protein F2P81_006061 [Scophthalmus maximus]